MNLAWDDGSVLQCGVILGGAATAAWIAAVFVRVLRGRTFTTLSLVGPPVALALWTLLAAGWLRNGGSAPSWFPLRVGSLESFGFIAPLLLLLALVFGALASSLREQGSSSPHASRPWKPALAVLLLETAPRLLVIALVVAWGADFSHGPGLPIAVAGGLLMHQMVAPWVLSRLWPGHALPNGALREGILSAARRAGVGIESVLVLETLEESEPDDPNDGAAKQAMQRDPEDRFAFTVGGILGPARVFLSQPLVADFPANWTCAVAAHELAHVLRRDLLRVAFAKIAWIGGYVGIRWALEGAGGLVQMILAVVYLFGPGWLCLRAYQRRCEVRADALAARWGFGEILADAIEAMEDRTLAGTGLRHRFRQLLSSHPPPDRRRVLLAAAVPGRGPA